MKSLKSIMAISYVVALTVAFIPAFASVQSYILQALAIIFLIHLMEVPLSFKYLKRYQGGLLTSIVLCVLFGVVHWVPLKNQSV